MVVVTIFLFTATGLAQEPVSDLVYVPGTDAQPGGPTYDFRVAMFEVRNDEFVTFLNDALANPGNERGQYLFFDLDSGDVYINTAMRGGTGSSGSGTLIFRAGDSEDISYSVSEGAYEVALGREDHPVTGVTWFGAIKYCNWLTIASGLEVDERAYGEGVADDLNAWRPVTIGATDWATGDLSGEEREALLEKLGYRLPMDGGDEAGGAGLYNEWFKAAAWDAASLVDRTYGFGRDALGSTDANYLTSGDPFDDGTTPVGYYDGTDHGGVFQTNPLGNQNSYGLFDLTGNVWEWVQDQSPSDPSRRRQRGGSWRSLPSSLPATFGADRLATSADAATGFRIVQSVPSGLLITPSDVPHASGIWGGPYDAPFVEQVVYRIANVSLETKSISVSADRLWLLVESGGAAVVGPIDVLPGESISVSVSIDPQCDDEVTLGINLGEVTFADEVGVAVAVRNVSLTVREPLSLSPGDGLVSQMPFAGSPRPPNDVYTFANASDLPVNWSATWEDTSDPPTGRAWITIDDRPDTRGAVMAYGEDPVVVAIDANEVASLPPDVYTADVHFVDDCTGESFTRRVSLTIVSPFSVTPVAAVEFSGVAGGPFTPADHEFTLQNELQVSLDWSARLCDEAPGSSTCTLPIDPWLTLDESGGTVVGGGSASAIATLNDLALGLETGSYSVTIRFEEPSTGFFVDREVTLEISGLLVDPDAGVTFDGPSGGPFLPESFVYTLHNSGLPEMTWVATVDFDPPIGEIGDVSWLLVSPMSGVIFDELDTDEAELSITTEASTLPIGIYNATVHFEANGAFTDRQVELVVGVDGFSVSMATVPAEHEQPSGPTYDFRIGRYEITNAQFVQFLNKAYANAFGGITPNPDARSHYLYFDTDSGDVYINDQQDASSGVDAPTATIDTLIFDASVGRVSFSAERYDVEEGYETHPVVGVTWYGAVKFCNWMTLMQGMTSPDERIYHEGTTPEEWSALSATPGILALRGFRLPMDGTDLSAGSFNEWFKAAAWLDSSETEAVYGFGRDTLGSVDANYKDSGDTFELGTTPVGHFDGVNTLADGSDTAETANGYGLSDMTGNVAEWVHDVGAGPTERGIRGGHYDSLGSSSLLRNDGRGSVSAGSALVFVGFRVVQAIEPVELALSPDPGERTRVTGFVGGDFDFGEGVDGRDYLSLTISNLGGQSADGIAVSVSPPWLEIIGSAPTQISPGSPVTIRLGVSEAGSMAGPSPAPSGDFALIPGSDVQMEGPIDARRFGPDYDFWVGRVEITNTDYAAFLNDTLADVRLDEPHDRSRHLYFDVDSGSVYINDQMLGAEGYDAPSSALTTLLYDGTIGRIRRDAGRYVIESGFDDHPVVGVSWFGAIKYCNWLTVMRGIPSSLQAYDESPSPNLSGWRPVVVDDATWTSVGLPLSTRVFLIEDTLGFRLPMDDGATTAAAYNERYKFASRGGVDDAGLPMFGATYGFGRDVLLSGDDPLAGVDANYLDSGETKENQATSVRFFNGSNRLLSTPSSCFPPPDAPAKTLDTDNGYGLYDVSGNAAEWTQEFGTDSSDRATRGGSWRDPATAELLKTSSRQTLSPGGTFDDVGFRVVRGTGQVVTVSVSTPQASTTFKHHFIIDLKEPFEVLPRSNLSSSGVYKDWFASLPNGLSETYALTNRSQSDMDWEVAVDQEWVDVSGPVVDVLTGTADGGAVLAFAVAINSQSELLGPGEQTATVELKNLSTGKTITRLVTLDIDPPVRAVALEADPQEFAGMWGGPFDSLPALPFDLISDVGFDLDYSVTSNAPWLIVEPVDPGDDLQGTLPGQGTLQVQATVGSAADSLLVGEHTAAIRFEFVDRSNNDLSGFVELEITLFVEEPMVVDQAEDPWVLDPNPDPALVLPNTYTLTNRGDSATEVLIAVDQDWVDVDLTLVEVFPGAGQERLVTVSLNDAVLALFDGEYIATLTFEDTLSGIIQCREIIVTIDEDISVAPFKDFASAGVAGGPIGPPLHVYTLTNPPRSNQGTIEWQAVVENPEADWLLINGASQASGLLGEGESTTLVLAIDPERTVGLAAGTHEARVSVVVLPNSEPVIRTVSLVVAVPEFAMVTSQVDPVVEQYPGPAYLFEMARFHTTNEQFVAFLNDALGNPGNERGEYLFFDSVTGDVFLNDARLGQVGSNMGSRTVEIFSPTDAGQIEYVGGAYEVVTSPSDFSIHPVTGVSWYGAIKYCNWLTIDQGMLPGDRCYEESTDSTPNAWRPITASLADWDARDLSDVEREALVNTCRGYRLPMDDGYNNTSVTTDRADDYDEWYKAAAWNPATLQTAVYGFGRSVLSAADSNFFGSGDPYDNSTTPVGYYDGSDHGGVFLTGANENAFGLFDMTGNVYQWMQGRFNTNSNSIDFRTIRGGSFNDSVDYEELKTESRTFAPPGLTAPTIGFRVVRVAAVSLGDFDLDGDVDRADFAPVGVCLTGPDVATIPGCPGLDLDGDGDVDLLDVASFQNVFTGSP